MSINQRIPTMNQPQAPICQSCGMPLAADEHKGINADGNKSEEYCSYCYKDGSFVNPNFTVGDQIKHVAKIGAEKMGVPIEQAKATASNIILTLKRWQS